MSRSFLFNSYKQYKDDTGVVATWLVKTASQYGYYDEKRKDQSQKASMPASASSLGSEPHTLKSMDHVFLAEWIAKKAKPNPEVPFYVSSKLDRAIKVRKQHRAWWDQRAHSDEQSVHDKNLSHDHFISILQVVQVILQSIGDKKPSKNRGTIRTESQMPPGSSAEVVNVFEGLDIEEPSQAFLTSEAVVPLKSQESNHRWKTIVRCEECGRCEDDRQEMVFALNCLFNDIYHIREYLKRIWEAYKRGEFDLTAVSITTNTAIDFVKSLQSDFRALFCLGNGFDVYVDIIFCQVCNLKGEDADFREQPGDPMNFKMFDYAERTFYSTHLLVHSFCQFSEDDEPLEHEPCVFGEYSPDSDRAKMSGRKKYHEDAGLFRDMLLEISAFANSQFKAPLEDELTRGIREMSIKGKPSFGLVFAVQIALDIHHILGTEVKRGYSELKSRTLEIQDSIEGALEYHKISKDGRCPETMVQELETIRNDIRVWVLSDIVPSMKTVLLKRDGIGLPEAEPFLLMKYHPWYCGLLLHHFQSRAQRQSILLANNLGTIVHCAHLYNALGQEKLIMRSWPDMDMFMQIHDTIKMFPEGRPSTRESYSASFIKALNLGDDSSSQGTNVSATKGLLRVNPLFEPSDFIGILEQTDLDLGSDLSSEDEWASAIKPAGQNDQRGQRQKTSKSARRRVQAVTRRSNRKKIAQSVGKQPIPLLRTLLTIVQQEAPKLYFLHFRLHLGCWKFLMNFKSSLSQNVRETMKAKLPEQTDPMPYLVLCALFTASESQLRISKHGQQEKAIRALLTSSNLSSSFIQRRRQAEQPTFAPGDLLSKAGSMLEDKLETDWGSQQLAKLEQLGVPTTASGPTEVQKACTDWCPHKTCVHDCHGHDH